MKTRSVAPDPLFFTLTVGLALFGLAMLSSASAFVAEAGGRAPTWFVTRQIVWAVAGFGVMAALAQLDYRRLDRHWVMMAALAVSVAALGAALLSAPLNNTWRWIRIGGVGVQPSEFVKVALVVILAQQLATRAPDRIRALVVPLGTTGLLGGMVFLQRDLGTATLLVLIGAAMLTVGGARILHLTGLGGIFAGLFALGVLADGYRMRRVLTFMDPFRDPLGDGFQLTQSLIALGAGGFTGVGFAGSEQKLLYLPVPHADFIFSVIGEELGFLGAVAVVLAFGGWAVRGLIISMRTPDAFGKLLGVGAVLAVGFQAFLHISVTTGLVPTTGLPLPFVSAGGSALVSSLAASGLVLSLSRVHS